MKFRQSKNCCYSSPTDNSEKQAIEQIASSSHCSHNSIGNDKINTFMPVVTTPLSRWSGRKQLNRTMEEAESFHSLCSDQINDDNSRNESIDAIFSSIAKQKNAFCPLSVEAKCRFCKADFPTYQLFHMHLARMHVIEIFKSSNLSITENSNCVSISCQTGSNRTSCNSASKETRNSVYSSESGCISFDDTIDSEIKDLLRPTTIATTSSLPMVDIGMLTGQNTSDLGLDVDELSDKEKNDVFDTEQWKTDLNHTYSINNFKNRLSQFSKNFKTHITLSPVGSSLHNSSSTSPHESSSSYRQLTYSSMNDDTSPFYFTAYSSNTTQEVENEEILHKPDNFSNHGVVVENFNENVEIQKGQNLFSQNNEVQSKQSVGTGNNFLKERTINFERYCAEKFDIKNRINKFNSLLHNNQYHRQCQRRLTGYTTRTTSVSHIVKALENNPFADDLKEFGNKKTSQNCLARYGLSNSAPTKPSALFSMRRLNNSTSFLKNDAKFMEVISANEFLDSFEQHRNEQTISDQQFVNSFQTAFRTISLYRRTRSYYEN